MHPTAPQRRRTHFAPGEADDALISLEALLENRSQDSTARGPARTIANTGLPVTGRMCTLRKTDEAIEIAHGKIHHTTPLKGE